MANIQNISREEYGDYLYDLFSRASEAGQFNFICSLLRVNGMEDTNWDVFSELKEAFEDYNHLLTIKDEALSVKSPWRVGLLMYCQSIEMTAPHEMLANLIRCLKKEKYHISPFRHLGRANKKKAFSWVPPSAKVKFRELKKWCEEIGENKLSEYIDSFYNDDIRNSFTHSDYIITDEYFRWTENSIAQQMELKDVSTLVSNCFNFYGALLWLHTNCLKDITKAKKYHKWPSFEVLELLNNEETLYGFNVHFSNGSKSTFTRTKNGVECCNIVFDGDGTFTFMVGDLDDLEPVWKVNGEPIEI